MMMAYVFQKVVCTIHQPSYPILVNKHCKVKLGRSQCYTSEGRLPPCINSNLCSIYAIPYRGGQIERIRFIYTMSLNR